MSSEDKTVKLVYDTSKEKPFMVLTKSNYTEEENGFNINGRRYSERSIINVLYDLIFVQRIKVILNSSVPNDLELITTRLANGDKRIKIKSIYEKRGKESKIRLVEERITLVDYIKKLENLRYKQLSSQ